MQTQTRNRLVYLAQELREKTPASIRAFIPFSEIFDNIAEHGLEGAFENASADASEYKKAYTEGAKTGKATKTEYYDLLVKSATNNLREISGSMSTQAYLKAAESIARASRVNELLADDVITYDPFAAELTSDVEVKPTLWHPIDGLIGGMATQGLTYLAAKQGTGKSRLMLSLALNSLNQGLVERVLYFQTEMSKGETNLILKPAIGHYPNIKPGQMEVNVGHTFNGVPLIDHIYEHCMLNPDYGRMVIIDSPDFLVSGDQTLQAAAMIDIVKKLSTIRKQSAYTFVASHLNRNQEPRNANMTISREKEQTALEWFNIWRNSETPNSNKQQLWITKQKSRHSRLVQQDNILPFEMDYVTLKVYDPLEGF